MSDRDQSISTERKSAPPRSSPQSTGPEAKLEILLKADSTGTLEAVASSVQGLGIGVIRLIRTEVGHIGKSDLLMAEAASRLIVGFNVDVLPRVKELAKEQRVEIRLYSVIYDLLNDLKRIASTLTQAAKETEKILGRAKVIALFTSGRKDIIVGCRIEEGVLTVGRQFRIISAPGPVYTGDIESLHIEKDSVKQAKAGQEAGIKISGFKRARVGDLVESFELERSRESPRWQPQGGVFRI